MKRSDKDRPWRRSALLAREKHDTRVLDATTEEALHASALKLLRERAAPDYGYYYEPEKPSEPSISEEVVKGLPEGPTRKAAEGEWKRHRAEMRDYNRDMEDWALIQQALSENDGKKAWAVLRNRNGYEYEGVQLVDLEGGVG